MRFTLYALLSIMLMLPCYTYAEEEEEESAPAQSFYFSIEPSIVANLTSGAKYCRVDIQVSTQNEEQFENIKLHAPAMRHELLMLLSEQNGKALRTPEGKEAFRKTALTAVQGVIEGLTGVDSVKELYFTGFFVQ